MDSDIGATATLVQQQHQMLDGNHHQGQKKQDQVNDTVASAEGHAVDRFRGEAGCSVKEIAVVAPDNDSVGDSSTQCSDVMDDDNEEEKTDVEESGAGDWIMNPPVSTIVQQHQAFDTTNGYIALPNPDSSNFSNVRVKDSSNVHLGNEVNYHGPVTVQQFIYTNPTPNQDAIELDVICPSDNISDLSTNKDNGAPNGCIFPQYTKLNKVTQWLWTWKRAVLSCVITLILLAIVVPITVHFTHQSDASVSPEIPTTSIEETGNFTTTVEVHPSGEVSPSLNHDSSVTRDDNDLTIQAQKPAQYNNTNNNNNNNINYNDNNNSNNNECGINSYIINRTNPLFNYGEETMPGQWPWLVALFVVRRDYVFTCCGTILTNRHVITAAHCLKLSVSSNDTVHPNVLVVALGRFRLRQWRELGTVNREVASFKIHPNYTHEATGDSDLAILTLRTPVEFSHFIKPICLWFGSTNLEDIVNKIGWVVGWGEDEEGHIHTELPRVTRERIVSQETCLRSHQAFYTLTSVRTFCAGFRNNSGPCNGDGGSGLVLFDSTTGRYYLRGIVSRSFSGIIPSCDLLNYVVYVDVAKYTSWIQEQITTTPTNTYNIFLRPTPAQPVPQPAPQPTPQPASQPDNNNNNNNNNNDNNYNECGISDHSEGANLLIANGQETLPGQWPWLVALFRNTTLKYKFQCAGSVLTTRHVLTAAHCLKLSLISNDTLHPNVLGVALGRFNLSRFREEGTVNREVASYKIHPEYAHTVNGDSNLAILILKTPVEFSSSIRPICLWFQSTNLQDVYNRVGYVVGWSERGHRYTEEPRMAMMPIVSLENCLWSYQGFVSLTSNRTFCAGMQDGTGPCNGDSGSGLVLFDATTGRYQLRGVVSRSVLGNEMLCDLTKFVVFVDVAKYQSWILQQIST